MNRIKQLVDHFTSPKSYNVSYTNPDGLSILTGPDGPPLLEMTLGEHLRLQTLHYGPKKMIVSDWQQRSYTYNEMDTYSDAIARALLAAGIKKGDRVAILMGNTVEYIGMLYGTAKIGAILVVLNPAYTVTELEFALNHTGCSMFITSPAMGAKSHEPFISHLSPGLIGNMGNKLPTLKHIVICEPRGGKIPIALQKFDSFSEFVTPHYSESRFHIPEDLDPNDSVNLQFTSGTTGLPKGACLSHRNILNNGRYIGDRMDLSSSDVVCIPVPLFHCFGLVLGSLAAFTHGSMGVYPCESFDPLLVLQSVPKYKATGLLGVPTMFIAEMEHPRFNEFDMSTLRTGIAAGSSVPQSVMQRIHKHLNLTELTIAYGMTETSPVSTQTTTTDPLDKRVSSVGRLMPLTTAKIIDKDGNIVKQGERGELCVSGYLLMTGYWNEPEKTAQVMRIEDGVRWMHTGDEAELDSEGYFSITGRIKDLIIRGGENILPLEIENRLMEHPEISQASVVGIDDERYGEVVGAFIIGNRIEYEAVRDWVREKLARYKAPKYVWWMGENLPLEFPQTASGKIRKVDLKLWGNRLSKGESYK